MIIRGKEAREKLFKGVEELALTVVTTLGPKGRNVALDRRWSSPTVIHDGVSIAKEIYLKDPFENMGAQLVMEASMKTADRAGDGTTTSTLLAYEISKAGLAKVNEGHNPMHMKKGIEQAVEFAVEELKKMSKPVTTREEIAQIGTISSTDPKIGEMIATAMDKVTKNGVIAVEDADTFETTIEYKEGMEFDKGYYSSGFITNPEKGLAELEDCFILFTDLKIDSPRDLADWLSKVLDDNNRKIVLIADSFDNNTIPLLVMNKQMDRVQCIAAQAPGFAIKRKWMLEDLATICGGTFISREAGRTLSSVTHEELGRAHRVESDVEHTRIIGGMGDPEKLKERLEQIKSEREHVTSDYERKQIDDRIAKLTGGVAIIKVGAQTEVELKEKKERIIDAVEATKSAVQEGIIPGGGSALYTISNELRKLTNRNEDIQAGIEVIRSALEKPFEKLMENAGLPLTYTPYEDQGVDVETGELVNLYDAGIIDPTKVTRQALQNAASVASMILTTEAVVTEYPEDKALPKDYQPLEEYTNI